MTDAVTTISKLANVDIIAPATPEKGIVISLKDQSAKVVLDSLAFATGTSWSIEDDVIIFREAPKEARSASDKPVEILTPEQGMAAFISSLSARQLDRMASGGAPLAYAEMNKYQQSVLKGILSPPTVGVGSGDVIRGLPAPEQVSVSFISLPYLTIGNPDGKEVFNLRLDTSPYIALKNTAKKDK
jgi:hypothetical protein